MYHSDSRMRTWFFLSPPESPIMGKKVLISPTDLSICRTCTYSQGSTREFGVNNLRFFPVPGLSCRWNPMEFTWDDSLLVNLPSEKIRSELIRAALPILSSIWPSKSISLIQYLTYLLILTPPMIMNLGQ